MRSTCLRHYGGLPLIRDMPEDLTAKAAAKNDGDFMPSSPRRLRARKLFAGLEQDVFAQHHALAIE